MCMWIFTQIGFFSAVRADPARVDGLPKDRPYVMVRARVEEDLVNLQGLWSELYEGEAPEILRWKGRDYPARVILAQEEWVQLAAALAEDIDYPNFKSRVTETQGWARHDLYSRVWGVMNDAARKLADMAKPKPKAKGRRWQAPSWRDGQTSLDRWFERNDYRPEEHGIEWEDDIPMPAPDLPEGTDSVVDPFHVEDESSTKDVEVLYEELRASFK